uniref:Uncharacterized protein n=1 Tax=Strombidium inclinatum TaxID=197538 RepID=A0A7S3IHM6_9SPIT|mmetsp:Transcript_16817/g.25911  ORF Transcript_16817/g.25911 Transcript_16817/m.25911 type:complete len:127 (+) Transcript_16817:539-919(+)
MICTFFFTSLILSIKYHVKSNEGILGAASVGTTLVGVLITSSYTTGGCINPAVGLVQSIFQASVYPKIFAGDLVKSSTWIYALAPACGGILAGLFQLLNGKVQALVAAQGKEEEETLMNHKIESSF